MPEQPQLAAAKLHQAHDAFMKMALARTAIFAAVLRACSPEAAAVLAPKPFRAVEKEFIDRGLKITEADILREAELKGGGRVLILAEHKSARDPRASRQMAGYCLSLWDVCHAKGWDTPPNIIALALYHGDGRFEPSPVLAASPIPGAADLLAFRPIVCDLREIPLAALREQPLAWGAMSVVLRAKEAVSREELGEIFTALKADDDLLAAAKTYIFAHWHTPEAIVDNAMMDAQLRGENDMPELGPMALAAIAKGEAQGRTKGRAEILARQLQHHFACEVPQPLQVRLADASLEELDTWAVRIFDAPDLEAVFKD